LNQADEIGGEERNSMMSDFCQGGKNNLDDESWLEQEI